MTGGWSPGQVVAELVRLSGLLDDAIAAADLAADAYADADATFRAAHAKAMLAAKADGATDAKAGAAADAHTEQARRRFVFARQMAQVSVETIRARRAQLSAWQTAGNTLKAELDMARTGPPTGP